MVSLSPHTYGPSSLRPAAAAAECATAASSCASRMGSSTLSSADATPATCAGVNADAAKSVPSAGLRGSALAYQRGKSADLCGTAHQRQRASTHERARAVAADVRLSPDVSERTQHLLYVEQQLSWIKPRGVARPAQQRTALREDATGRARQFERRHLPKRQRTSST